MAPSQEATGERIRASRRALGLSQADLAGEDLSASYVSLIEAGKRTPTRNIAELLAARLQTTAEFLLEGIDVRARDEQELRLRYAELALQNGEAAEALSHFERLREETDPGSKLYRESEWGSCRALEALGRLEEAIDGYDKVRAAAAADPQRGERWAESVIALCRSSIEAGDVGRSIDLGEAALAHIGGLGLGLSDLQVQIASTLVGAYYRRGDLVRAQNLVNDLIGAVEGQSRVAQGAAYWNASLVAESRGHLGEAIGLAEKALAMYAESDQLRSLARLRVAYAWLLLRQAEPAIELARDLLVTARSELADTGSTVDLGYCDTELARCELLAGNTTEAIKLAQQAVATLGESRLESGAPMLIIGQALVAEGDIDGGRAQVAHASQTLQHAAAGREAAAAWREAGDVLSQVGEPVAAMDAYQRALGLLGVTAAPTPASLRSIAEA